MWRVQLVLPQSPVPLRLACDSRAFAAPSPSEHAKMPAMKLIVTVLGLACVALAVMYFTMPADQLPAFVPGYQPGMTRIHTTHGAAAAAAGIILLAMGWLMGRRLI